MVGKTFTALEAIPPSKDLKFKSTFYDQSFPPLVTLVSVLSPERGKSGSINHPEHIFMPEDETESETVFTVMFT